MLVYEDPVSRTWAFRALEAILLVVTVSFVVPLVYLTHMLPPIAKQSRIAEATDGDITRIQVPTQQRERWHFHVPNDEELAILWDNNE